MPASFGSLGAAVSFFFLIAFLGGIGVVLIGLWKVFVKGGQPGWACIIPIYNLYCWVKIAGKEWWWMLFYFVPVVNFVVAVMVIIAVAKKFGKGAGFVLGLIFLPPIFIPILGFGSALYQSAASAEPVEPAIPVEPTASVQSAVPAGSAAQIEPATPVESAHPLPDYVAPGQPPSSGGAAKTAVWIGILVIAVMVAVLVAAITLAGKKPPATAPAATGEQAPPPAQETAKTTPSAPAFSVAPVDSNAFWNLLNADQRQAYQFDGFLGRHCFETDNYDGLSDAERADEEKHLIDTLRGPRSGNSCRAIAALGALHSADALPLLRPMALEPDPKKLNSEAANRTRWMAVRGLGIIGDTASVPGLIDLLHHNSSHVRWEAQCALVRLTGRNFSNDWNAWGDWWTSQNGRPPLNAEPTHWWPNQPDASQLKDALADDDRKFLREAKSGKSRRPPKSDAAIDDAFWLGLDRGNYQRYRGELRKAPHVLAVRPTHFDLNKNLARGIGIRYGPIDGKLASLSVSFAELVCCAYNVAWDEELLTRMEMPDRWRQGQLTNRFDLIDTVRDPDAQWLQDDARQLLRDQFGLAWHWEMRDTDVLLVKVKDPALLASKQLTDFSTSRSIPEAVSSWANFFGRTVIDETGLTNRYDKGLDDIPAAYHADRTKDLGANNAFLAGYGLELVPARRPLEWLAMDQVKNVNTKSE